MSRDLRIRAVYRKQIDEDKLALAFLLLAKSLSEETNNPDATKPEHPDVKAA